MRKKGSRCSKDMPTVTLIHSVKLQDRLQVQNSRQSRFKRQGHRQPHSHHSDLEGQDPQKQIPPLHTIMTSRIHHTRTHSDPMYTAVLNSVSNTSYIGGRELWNENSSLAGIDGTKITHADYCMCAYVLCMSLCTSMC